MISSLDMNKLWTLGLQEIDPLNPRPEQMNINEIAHSLSLICRHGGHIKGHYSVAEHSVIMSLVSDEADPLWRLMHDAPEAFTNDCPRPIKRLLPGYKAIEDRFMSCIAEAFNLQGTAVPQSVKDVDDDMLIAEMLVLRGVQKPPIDVARCEWMMNWLKDSEGLQSQYAKCLFLQRFEMLT